MRARLLPGPAEPTAMVRRRARELEDRQDMVGLMRMGMTGVEASDGQTEREGGRRARAQLRRPADLQQQHARPAAPDEMLNPHLTTRAACAIEPSKGTKQRG